METYYHKINSFLAVFLYYINGIIEYMLDFGILQGKGGI